MLPMTPHQQHFYNTFPQTWWLKTTAMCSPSILEAGSWKSVSLGPNCPFGVSRGESIFCLFTFQLFQQLLYHFNIKTSLFKVLKAASKLQKTWDFCFVLAKYDNTHKFWELGHMYVLGG